jgi:hypothetical protein
MRSAFGRQRSAGATSSPNIDEFYGFRGLNLTDPDEEMSPGDSPWTINSRMYARNDGESRVANRTRKGASHLSTAAGLTADVQNVATSVGDLDFSTTKVVANPMVFTATKALTRLDTEIKKIGQASGHVIVEIYSDNGGVPGTLLAQSSILGSAIGSSYAYLTSYFIDAPTVTVGVTYWAVYYIQDNGSGSYYINQTAAGAMLELFSIDGGMAWNSINCGIHYKTFLSTPGTVKGFSVRYPSDVTQAQILMAHGTSMYAIPKSTGTPAAIDTGLSASASRYRFDQWDNFSLYANEFDPLRQWNGVDAPSNVLNCPITNPDNVIVWQNRVFVYKGTRVIFSELGDYQTWPSVNFFYIPITTPNSPDHIAGWKIFQDNMVFWTHLTKYQVIGSNISNFTYKEVVGTKGACSQEAIVTDRNYAYFMGDDKQIYRWNGGGDDVLLSQNVESELQGIDDIKAVRLHLYRNQLRVYYSKNGEGRMLLLDIEMSVPTQGDWRWFLDTGHPVCGSANMYLDKDDPLIEFSSVVGRVYFGETQYNDLGKKIDWKYWTPYKTYGYRRRNGQSFGGASTKKRIKRFRPIVRVEDADYTMSVGKDMDFENNPDMRAYVVSGGGAKFGNFKWGDGTKWGKKKQVMNTSGMSGRGNFIQYRFEREGVNTPVELYGYVAQYKIGKPK